ncbi:MAG: hypothetical protein HY044_04445 [Candidatus Woesebacteria bacterium]|nr:MAG: hypothetical protein HY044_04445 [Candidatus Woesebacteria bacterium]
MKKNTLILAIVALLVGLGGGFFGGVTYQKGQRSNLGQLAQNRTQIRGGNRPVVGQILSMDDKSITVKMQDGSSKIVILTDSTTITQSTTAAKSDLSNGKEVLVLGTTNSDGSVTATNVSINPQFRER